MAIACRHFVAETTHSRGARGDFVACQSVAVLTNLAEMGTWFDSKQPRNLAEREATWDVHERQAGPNNPVAITLRPHFPGERGWRSVVSTAA